jgi:hypothetical protein
MVGIEHPIMQDGMGSGSFTTGSIAAAVSQAGGLGSVSVADLWAEPADAEKVFRGQMDLVASKTDKPFAANIPVGVDYTGEVLEASRQHLQYVLDARRSDSAIASQLRVVTTSGGPPDKFTALIKEAAAGPYVRPGSQRPRRDRHPDSHQRRSAGRAWPRGRPVLRGRRCRDGNAVHPYRGEPVAPGDGQRPARGERRR